MQIEKRSLLRDERGLSTVEYTVLLVLIVACAVGLWSEFGEILVDRLEGSKTEFDDEVKVVPSGTYPFPRVRRSPGFLSLGWGAAHAFLSSARGTVSVEYVMVLVLVALPCALAVRALGPPLVALFLAEKAVLLFPLSF